MQGERIFFSSDAKLPQDTSGPIAKLRQKELYAIQARPHIYTLHTNETKLMLGLPDNCMLLQF